MYYFYLAKERLNSETYDQILKSTKLFSEFEITEKEEEDKKNNLYEGYLIQNEISKIKYMKNFDYILGVSDMNINDLKSYVQQQKAKNILYISDPLNELFGNMINENRYELVLNDLKICEYLIDPTFKELAIKATYLFILILAFLYLLIDNLQFMIGHGYTNYNVRIEVKKLINFPNSTMYNNNIKNEILIVSLIDKLKSYIK